MYNQKKMKMKTGKSWEGIEEIVEEEKDLQDKTN